jgi:hypothetical protein
MATAVRLLPSEPGVPSMANSRELVECVSSALELPLTEVTGHMRHLREAGLVTTGGRGITAPRMTYEDAASLICSLYGTALMKDGVTSVTALKALPAIYQGARRGSRLSMRWQLSYVGPVDLLGSEPTGGVTAGLAAALRLLGRGNEFIRQAAYRIPDAELRVRFSVQFPQHFASLTTKFAGVSEVWTFGQRGKPKTRRTNACDEVGLREIAKCLEAP